MLIAMPVTAAPAPSRLLEAAASCANSASLAPAEKNAYTSR